VTRSQGNTHDQSIGEVFALQLVIRASMRDLVNIASAYTL
jgi:hypothetical protein